VKHTLLSGRQRKLETATMVAFGRGLRRFGNSNVYISVYLVVRFSKYLLPMRCFWCKTIEAKKIQI